MLEGPAKIPLYQVICKHLLSTYWLLWKQKEVNKNCALEKSSSLGGCQCLNKHEKRTCRGKCSTWGLYLEFISEKAMGTTAKWEQSPRYPDARKQEMPGEPGKQECA